MASALVALAVGWVPPWLRTGIVRPRLWGLGLLGIGLWCLAQIPSPYRHFTDTGGTGTTVLLALLAGALIALACSGVRRTHR